MKKITKVISTVIGIAVLLSIVGLSISTSAYKRKTKRLKAEKTELVQVIDSLKKRCERLENMDAITVNTTFEVKNINTLGVQRNGNMQMLAESYASLTRRNVLQAIDSLNKKQN